MSATFTKSVFLEDFFKYRGRRHGPEIAQMILERYYPHLAGVPMVSADQMAADIRNSDFAELFVHAMNRLDTGALFASYIHGQDHIERVAVCSAWLAIEKGVSAEFFSMCMECAKYHDVGRESDGEDRAHGPRGAQKIAALCADQKEPARSMIAAAVAAHSLEEDAARKVFEQWRLSGQKTWEQYRLLLSILKDADALDRFRLNNDSLDTRFLRLDASVRLVRAACEMVNF